MGVDPMSASQLRPGTVIDAFRLEEPLPVGTTAAFWRVARTGGDPNGGADSDLPLLMKVPRLADGAHAINIVGFEVEQMILPKLTGPHVPHFIASGGLQNPYIVMELIRGESLRAWLPKLPLPADEVAAIGVKVAAALHDVHRQGVIHLDLKPSNVMLRESGEAALIDFGFSRHLELPDLLAEEIPGPIGTGAYIAPEQLLGNRNDPRSDIFALGVILYFFATGERPFGEPKGVREWRRRLYHDPAPPRALRPDCPPWLQEIILRCLEIDPGQRHATAAQLAFDLQHPQQIVVTSRGERSTRSGPMRALARWIGGKRLPPALQQGVGRQLEKSPIIMAAIDLAPGMERLAQELAVAVGRILQTQPDARLTCVNVLRQSRVALDPTEDEQGRNLHLRRLAELQYWARGLPIPAHGITYHVFEAVNPAGALLDYARNNHVDHIVLAASGSSRLRRYLGSVSSQIVAEAPCTVTVVRATDRRT
jgi:nucleotide-binding universal stress UspA family protein